MAKINVLHVLSTNRFSGAEKIAGQICRNLNGDSFNVHVLCNGGELLRRYRKEGLDVLDLNASRYDPWNVAAFIGIIRRLDVRIVHAHGARASVFALVCRTFAGRRYRIVSHMHGCRQWRKSKGLLSAVDGYFAHRYDMNIVCGTGMYSRFMEQGRRPDASKVMVISNALEIEGAAERDDRSSGRERAAKDAFVYGFIGRFSKPKGLIPFLSKIIENGDLLDDARLVLVGDGEDMKTLRRMAAESGLAQRIVFAGNRDDVLDYLRGFDVLVLPSISEGLPMVILEAMSAGKPVLAFDVGSVGEALRDDINGYLVEAGDYDAFIRHMRRLKDGGEELVTLGKNGRALLESEFGMDRYMEKIEDLYRSLYRDETRERPPC
ncbi:MAG: glycosyltransferase family 4 protein [Candidatus Krumholzibacteria bacterium]|nr:glycosyltransferase family 4 protein [Candidatus Krumholzibacteria bacterium]